MAEAFSQGLHAHYVPSDGQSGIIVHPRGIFALEL
jgi:hypothetical protein